LSREKEKGRSDSFGAPFFLGKREDEKQLVRSHQLFIGKNSFEPPRFILIVQHHDRNHTQRLFAGMALRHFALQILQKTIREMVQRTLAPGILLVPRAAVRTDEFHRVLLRIAVQSSPARAAHTYRYYYITPVHGDCPPQIHVHMQ
jgi:hypothetical protein